jgi:hypothetical protein
VTQYTELGGPTFEEGLYVLILSLLRTEVTTKILVAVCGYAHICSSENFFSCYKEIGFNYQPGLVCSQVVTQKRTVRDDVIPPRTQLNKSSSTTEVVCEGNVSYFVGHIDHLQ